MGELLKLPVGIENFEKIRTEGFYYVDKTGLLKELLNHWGEVNLLTRPRRFGKSLNMNMFQYFFQYGCDAALFEGLEIAKEQALCETYMGKFPVILVTLKEVCGRSYGAARDMLCSVIGCEAMNFQFLTESNKLSEREKLQYEQLIEIGKAGGPMFAMTDDVLVNSLRTLTEVLRKHYEKKVILLIDEYDVPLDKAQQSGYYDEMLTLLRSLFGRVLKGNQSLQFAVLTGCLRISKESIFTGLNNLKVMSVTDVRFDEYFGFSEREVREMLEYYGLESHFDAIRAWYDGYRFGNVDVYCPWDVINYIDLLRAEPDALPQAYWVNSSGNDIIRNFLRKATPGTRKELERLIDGEGIVQKINQELTYRELYKSMENFWSVLLTTGYLTQKEKLDNEVYRLVIPNLEIRKIFIEQILEWFQEEARRDTPKLDAFCAAFQKGDAEEAEKLFNSYLTRTISIRDTSIRKNKKENFYHGILLGLLSHREDWLVESNAESGNGFSDILVESAEESVGILIEVKYPDGSSLEQGCAEALEQIEKKGYVTRLIEDGMMVIYEYGIACNRKQCKVRMRREEVWG